MLEAGVVGEAGEIYLLDKTSNEVSRLDAQFVFEYARVRRCTELIECSYTEDTSPLATEPRELCRSWQMRTGGLCSRIGLMSRRVRISKRFVRLPFSPCCWESFIKHLARFKTLYLLPSLKHIVSYNL